MRVDRGNSGDFTLDPAELAAKFALTQDDFRSRMRRGLAACTVEIGEGEDRGSCRLNVRLGNRIWRGVFDSEGDLVSETMGFVRATMSRRDVGDG